MGFNLCTARDEIPRMCIYLHVYIGTIGQCNINITDCRRNGHDFQTGSSHIRHNSDLIDESRSQ